MILDMINIVTIVYALNNFFTFFHSIYHATKARDHGFFPFCIHAIFQILFRQLPLAITRSITTKEIGLINDLMGSGAVE